jgi:uncharacterized RDD family membrane protein YckC
MSDDQPTGEYQYAGFWWRLVAHLIDGVVLCFVLFIVDFFVALMIIVSTAGLGLIPAYGFNSLLNLVIGWLYFALTESSEMQATPGKRCCKIIVTDLHGNRVSFGRASGRYFAKIVSVLTLGIGFLMAGLTQRKQALHDLIADCLVLRRRPEILRLPGEGAVTT